MANLDSIKRVITKERADDETFAVLLRLPDVALAHSDGQSLKRNTTLCEIGSRGIRNSLILQTGDRQKGKTLQ